MVKINIIPGEYVTLRVDKIPPQYIIANDATVNSNRFSLLSETTSPFFKPSSCRATAKLTVFCKIVL